MKLSIGKVFILIAFLSYTSGFLHFAFNKKNIIGYDAAGYYSYLPAIFIYNDFKFDFVNSLPDDVRPEPKGIDLVHTADGKTVNKWHIGTAILMMPFFLLAHFVSSVFHLPANGYSTMYHIGIFAASLFYFLSGLYILSIVLRRFYQDKVVALTICAIALGTNLFYYSSLDFGMSHCYSFFLFSLFLWLVIQWHEQPSFKRTVLIGFTAGLITIVRPSNVLILIVFLIYDVRDKETFKNKLLFFKTHFRLLSVMAWCFVIAVLPQLIYWKTVSGKFIFDSYPGENFYFSNPHVFQGLFGFRKGWFIYTPLMLLIIPGFIHSVRSKKSFSIATLIFTIINIYVAFSWWTWWYGGSFSSRAMIESYALLSLPLASFFEFISHKKTTTRKIVFSSMALLVLLNLFQTYQYVARIIDFQRMTFKEYINIFGRTSFPDNYYKLLKEPDLEYAQLGFNERSGDFPYLKEIKKTKVSIKDIYDKYVCVELGYNSEIMANRDSVKEWETFTLLEFDGHQCLLKAANNRFVYADESRSLKLFADNRPENSWNFFRLFDLGNNYYAFKNKRSLFVSVADSSDVQLVADKKIPSENEIFIVEPVKSGGFLFQIPW